MIMYFRRRYIEVLGSSQTVGVVAAKNRQLRPTKNCEQPSHGHRKR
jgi:hypothetical protein